jgi:hypothetical protein
MSLTLGPCLPQNTSSSTQVLELFSRSGNSRCQIIRLRGVESIVIGAHARPHAANHLKHKCRQSKKKRVLRKYHTVYFLFFSSSRNPPSVLVSSVNSFTQFPPFVTASRHMFISAVRDGLEAPCTLWHKS